MASETEAWSVPNERSAVIIEEMSNVALILVQSDLFGRPDRPRELAKLLSSAADVSKVSAVYKRYLSPAKNDVNAEILFCAKVETPLSAFELRANLAVLEQAPNLGRSFQRFSLLTFNQEVVLNPQMTLPHPAILLDSLVLRLTCEVWNQYFHPVVQQTLFDLERKADMAHNIEFYSQPPLRVSA